MCLTLLPNLTWTSHSNLTTSRAHQASAVYRLASSHSTLSDDDEWCLLGIPCCWWGERTTAQRFGALALAGWLVSLFHRCLLFLLLPLQCLQLFCFLLLGQKREFNFDLNQTSSIDGCASRISTSEVKSICLKFQQNLCVFKKVFFSEDFVDWRPLLSNMLLHLQLEERGMEEDGKSCFWDCLLYSAQVWCFASLPKSIKF